LDLNLGALAGPFFVQFLTVTATLLLAETRWRPCLYENDWSCGAHASGPERGISLAQIARNVVDVGVGRVA
jgi:hypothetical protein